MCPPSYQVNAPFGTNIGGVNSAFFETSPESQYDSWLTIGLTDGNNGEISSAGIDWNSWTETVAWFLHLPTRLPRVPQHLD